MITLAMGTEDQLLVLQAQTFITAAQNQSSRTESEPIVLGGHRVVSLIEKKEHRGGSSWRKSWLLDGQRAGWNELRWILRKHIDLVI